MFSGPALRKMDKLVKHHEETKAVGKTLKEGTSEPFLFLICRKHCANLKFKLAKWIFGSCGCII